MKITLICADNDRDNDLIKQLMASGHEVNYIYCNDNKYQQMTFINRYYRNGSVYIDEESRARLYTSISESDRVHITVPFRFGYFACLIAQELNVPITAVFNVNFYEFLPVFKPIPVRVARFLIYRVLFEAVFSKCKTVIFTSTQMKNEFSYFIRKPFNFAIIRNYVPSVFRYFPILKPSSFRNKFVILYSEETPVKRDFKLLIEALSNCKHKESIQLVLSSCSQLRDFIMSYAEGKGINEPVFGAFNTSDVARAMNYSDILFHPYLKEYEPVSCIRAECCGLTVLTAKNELTKEFAMNANMIFSVNSTEALTNAIDYLYEHPEEIKSSSKKLVELSKQFEKANCLKQTEEAIIS